MARTEALTRDEVCAILESWKTGDISDHEMHLWVTANYFPAHQQVAPGEPPQVARAIGVVLTEFECTEPPYKFSRAVATLASAFINAQEHELSARERDFHLAIRTA